MPSKLDLLGKQCGSRLAVFGAFVRERLALLVGGLVRRREFGHDKPFIPKHNGIAGSLLAGVALDGMGSLMARREECLYMILLPPALQGVSRQLCQYRAPDTTEGTTRQRMLWSMPNQARPDGAVTYSQGQKTRGHL